MSGRDYDAEWEQLEQDFYEDALRYRRWRRRMGVAIALRVIAVFGVGYLVGFQYGGFIGGIVLFTLLVAEVVLPWERRRGEDQ